MVTPTSPPKRRRPPFLPSPEPARDEGDGLDEGAADDPEHGREKNLFFASRDLVPRLLMPGQREKPREEAAVIIIVEHTSDLWRGGPQ